MTGVQTCALPISVPELTLVAEGDGQAILTETRPLPVSLTDWLAGNSPVATVPSLAEVPTIDGRLDEPLWTRAIRLRRFFDVDGIGEAPVATRVRLGRTPAGLCVAIECHDPDIAKLVASERPRDGSIWRDDFVELFIDSNLDRTTYRHLALNASGSIYDSDGPNNSAWNGRWTSAVTRQDDRWTVELFIPWSDLGGRPRAGAQWGFNVARRRPRHRPGPAYTFWSPTLKGGSHVPERFGILSFR